MAVPSPLDAPMLSRDLQKEKPTHFFSKPHAPPGETLPFSLTVHDVIHLEAEEGALLRKDSKTPQASLILEIKPHKIVEGLVKRPCQERPL